MSELKLEEHSFFTQAKTNVAMKGEFKEKSNLVKALENICNNTELRINGGNWYTREIRKAIEENT